MIWMPRLKFIGMNLVGHIQLKVKTEESIMILPHVQAVTCTLVMLLCPSTLPGLNFPKDFSTLSFGREFRRNLSMSSKLLLFY